MSALQVVSSLDGLAPLFGAAVLELLAAGEAAGLDPVVYETTRSDALQAQYFAEGASKAQTVAHSWHGYGLAADIISQAHGWDSPEFFAQLGALAPACGLTWGGDWVSFPDPCHFQWGECRASPSQRAIALMASGGVEAVWQACGAA